MQTPDTSDRPPLGWQLEARTAMLTMWHRLLNIHDHLDLNDPESMAIAEVTTLIARKLKEIDGRWPKRRT